MLGKTKPRSLWNNLINAGISGSTENALFHKVRLINLFCIVGISTIGFFGIYNFYLGKEISGVVELFLSLGFALGALGLRFTRNVDQISSFLLFLLLVTLLFLLYTGGIEGTGIFWLFTFPVTAFFLKGKRGGWFWVIYLIILYLEFVLFSQLNLLLIPYSFVTIRQALISLVVVSFLIYFYEDVNEKSQKIIIKKEVELEHEKEIDKAKTEFISLASHQLRTPLSAMKWIMNSILQKGESLTMEQKNYMDDLYASNERMIALVNSLLNISRIDSGRLTIEAKPTNIDKIVENLKKQLQGKIESKELKLAIEIGSLGEVNIDPKLLNEILTNLLTNAIKYSKFGGRITIKVYIKNEELFFYISDTGYGIPENEQEKVFNKFFRANNIIKIETEGSGLGLYLTKMLVDSLKGKIGFTSKEGEGSTFWVSLPINGISRKGEVGLNS